ncbi:hypothetical protein [Thermobifida cellulosilytica]|mgnify:CR=1 FL=1|uniref:ATP synthase protein I n=1 Tax=Thermobifida cellulosilytica TB100 TaxID=665004 RepID=A0A147KFY7_THECS|nr:hypothetical protein [Thermobifida cellulosilytica]KUP96178.1 hypothetical protein AC529_13395 [Thermobifida cellulosilytica TB100]
MQEHDAKVLRGAAIPTLVVGGGSTAVFLAISGTVGVLGALAALLLVLAFFGVSGWAVAHLSRRNPDLFLPATLGAFLVKAVILGAALLTLRNTDPAWLDTTAFAVTSLLCVVSWLGGHVRVLATTKTLHVDPEPSAVSGPEARHEKP